MTHSLRKHPTRTDHQHYSNVFLTASLSHGRASRCRRDAFVSVDTVETLHSRLKALIAGSRLPGAVHWHGHKPRSTTTVHMLSMVRDIGPHPFRTPRTEEHVRNLLQDCLSTLVRGRPACGVFLDTLHALFGRRDASSVQQHEEDAKSVLQPHCRHKRARTTD